MRSAARRIVLAALLTVAAAACETAPRTNTEVAPAQAGSAASVASAAGHSGTGTITPLPAGAGSSSVAGTAGGSAGSLAAGASALDAASGAGADAGAPPLPDASEPSSDAASPSPGCRSPAAIAAGTSRVTLQHEGAERSYVTYVPSGITSGTPLPLVLDFHGNGGSASQQQSSSGWDAVADRERFIVVYPEGIARAWNVGNCCGEPFERNLDDVGFAKAIVAKIGAEACIDARRVYATGLSNGAGLTHRLACEAADVFAAIAAASADLVTDPCTPARPISELSVRGLSDTLVAYAGGNVGSTGWLSPGAKGTLELWKEINHCIGSVETDREYCETYSECSGGVEVTLCSLPGVGHILYDNRLGFSVPEAAWEMFQRQPLR